MEMVNLMVSESKTAYYNVGQHRKLISWHKYVLKGQWLTVLSQRKEDTYWLMEQQFIPQAKQPHLNNQVTYLN
jgi:hypothetical protein